MRSLPLWAQGNTPRQLLRGILADPPECTAPRTGWGDRALRFHGTNPERLRRYYANLQREALADQDAGRGTPFTDLCSQMRPDELIERLLTENNCTI